MKMLRWMRGGVVSHDKVPDESIRGTVKVANLTGKVQVKSKGGIVV